MRIVFSTRKSHFRRAAIFLDRDGVINRRRVNDYVLEWSQFVFIPGIQEALKDLSTLQLPMILVSNQSAVGRGLLRPSVLGEITLRLHETLLRDRVRFAAYYYCTHRPEERCVCRKPRPGMLLRAAADFNVDLSRSIFIGDSETDVQAAYAAGCRPVLFHSRFGSSSDGLVCVRDLPVAHTAKHLFKSAIRCLRAAEHAEGGLAQVGL